MLHELTKTVLLIVASLFPIINPPAAAFIILSMVPHASPAERAELARRIAINSFVILLASLSIGAYLLSFLGISIAVLRVAGGFIIAMAGWNLLQSSGDDGSEAQPVAGGDSTLRIKAFYPFTLPITVGPGSISVAITLGAHLPAELHESHLLSPRVLIAAIGGIVLICLIIYLCYLYARKAEQLLGRSGTSMVMRLSSFILLCIGVQIISTGIKAYLQTVGKI